MYPDFDQDAGTSSASGERIEEDTKKTKWLMNMVELVAEIDILFSMLIKFHNI